MYQRLECRLIWLCKLQQLPSDWEVFEGEVEMICMWNTQCSSTQTVFYFAFPLKILFFSVCRSPVFPCWNRGFDLFDVGSCRWEAPEYPAFQGQLHNSIAFSSGYNTSPWQKRNNSEAGQLHTLQYAIGKSWKNVPISLVFLLATVVVVHLLISLKVKMFVLQFVS